VLNICNFISRLSDCMDNHNNPENLTGFKPGQKLLYLTVFGGQPDTRIVTFRREGDEPGYIVVHVDEFGGYISPQSLHSLESIRDKFDSHDDKEKRRWRAVHDGIIPAVFPPLSDEEIDKIIDDNKEWCKAYEKRQRKWSREDAEARVLDQIPEDQKHTDGDEDDHEYGPSVVHGSSPTCQP